MNGAKLVGIQINVNSDVQCTIDMDINSIGAISIAKNEDNVVIEFVCKSCDQDTSNSISKSESIQKLLLSLN